MTTPAIDELKTRARLRLNRARADEPALQLRDCLVAVARDVGFADWEHARRVLGGSARNGNDLGTFWYAPRCATLLNEWFSEYGQARESLERSRGSFLLPYARQFVVVLDDFVRELGMDPAQPAWAECGRDLVVGYGTPAWQRLCADRLRATRGA